VKGQKFFEQAMKKSPEEKDTDLFPRLLNKPPERKEFEKKLTISTMNKPPEKYENRFFRFAPRSAKTSTLIPFVSFSVIMLFPRSAFRAFFIGRTIRLTNIRENSQIITISFHDLKELTSPAFIKVKFFIKH
jgi:hypothetical protein